MELGDFRCYLPVSRSGDVLVALPTKYIQTPLVVDRRQTPQGLR